MPAVAIGIKLGPKILKLAKTLKVGKVGLFAASAGAYSYLFTWQFAALILLMLFVHESGHIWAMKRCGIKTRGIYFIPFLGGVAMADEQFPSRRDEAYIAIMGPLWGLVLVVLAAIAYLVTENPFFAAAVSWMALVNLFNLLPINPLDGGRIIKSISYSIHSHLGFLLLVLGVVASGFLAFKVGFGLFVFLLIVGVIELLFEYFAERKGEMLPAMDIPEVGVSALSYVLVVSALFWAMAWAAAVPGAELAMEIMKG